MARIQRAVVSGVPKELVVLFRFTLKYEARGMAVAVRRLNSFDDGSRIDHRYIGLSRSIHHPLRPVEPSYGERRNIVPKSLLENKVVAVSRAVKPFSRRYILQTRLPIGSSKLQDAVYLEAQLSSDHQE